MKEAKISREIKKLEAIKRMKMMQLLPNIIEEFEKENVIHYSEWRGILYWLSNKPKWLEYIQKFEEKYNALVYHAEFSQTEFGDCLSLLYVSDYKDEWRMDVAALKQRYPVVYVWNIDDDIYSEFGTISLVPMNGGVKRTA